MNRILLPVFFLILLFSPYIQAKEKAQYTEANTFKANAGQVIDQYGKENPRVLYLYSGTSMNVQLRSTGWSYDLHQRITKEEDVEACNFRFHRVDVELLGANTKAEIEAVEEDMAPTYSYSEGKKVRVLRAFSKVLYKHIYPGIDLEFLTRSDRAEPVKYNFIVHAGADINAIRMRYSGATKNQLLAGDVSLQTSLGTVLESVPYSAYIDASGSRREANVSFRSLGNGVYGFSLANAKLNVDLLIDPIPAQSWGTYFGGSSAENNCAMTLSDSGQVILTGNTSSTSNIATSGVYQGTYGGSTDAFLVKYSPTGARIWSTYFGGSANDQGFSVRTDHQGNIFLAGTTSSTGLAAAGAFQNTQAGGADAYLAKFTPDGTLLWMSYFGGVNGDNGRGVAVDAFGNAYLVGFTQNTSGIASLGAQQTTVGGTYDGFVSSWTSSGSLNWATYLGGAAFDYGYSVTFSDVSNTLFVAGSTSSSAGIATPNAADTSFNGGTDAFLAAYSPAGALQWCTYYGGSATDDGNGVADDIAGDVYITGATASTSGIASAGAHQTAMAGVNDAFLARFTQNGQFKWGTYKGGSGNDYGWSVSCDRYRNVYLAGSTASASGMASAGAYQSIFGGIEDGFVARFDSLSHFYSCSYIGGAASERVKSIRNDSIGSVFIGGYTQSNDSISSASAAQIASGGALDGFVMKLVNCNAAPTTPTSIIGSSSACLGNTAAPFVVHDDGTATFFSWTVSGAGNSIIGNDSLAHVSWDPSFTGYAQVCVTAYNSCGSSAMVCKDSIAAQVPPTVQLNAQGEACSNAGAMVLSGGLPAGGVFSGNHVTAGLFNAAGLLPGTQTITYTYTDGFGCSAAASQPIVVLSPPLVDIASLPATCFTASPFNLGGGTPLGGTYSGLGVSGGVLTPATAGIGFSTVYYTYSDGHCANVDSTLQEIYGLPAIQINSLNNLCLNDDSVHLDGTATPFGGVFTGPGVQNGYFNPELAGAGLHALTYSYMDANACGNSDSIAIEVYPLPNVHLNAGDSILCAGETTMLSASGAANYVWSPIVFSGTDTLVSPVNATEFTLMGTDLNGCKGYDTLAIDVLPLPAVSASITSPIVCAGSLDTLIAQGALNYTWNPVVSEVGGVFAIIPLANTSYLLTGTAANGCSDTASVEVNVLSVPLLSATLSASSICAGQVDTLDVSGGINYSWQPGSLSGAQQVISPSSNTVYTVSSTGLNGCVGIDSVSLIVHPLPTVQAGVTAAAICVGTMDTLTATGASSYSWSPSVSLNGGFYTIQPSNPTTYILTGTNQYGCSNTSSVFVTVNMLPVVTATASSDIVCSGVADTLHATGALTYQWQPLALSSAQCIVYPPLTTTYTVTGFSADNCVSSDTLTIHVLPSPVVTFTNPLAICENATSMQLNALPAGGVFSGAGVAGSVFDPQQVGAGTHGVVYSVSDGNCTTDTLEEITVHPVPIVNAGLDTLICQGQSILLGSDSLAGASYAWSPAANLNNVANARPLFTAGTSALYQLVVTNAFLCSDTDRVSVNVDPCLGVVAVDQSKQIKVFPDPFNNQLFIDFEKLAIYDNTVFELYDELGRCLLRKVLADRLTTLNTIDLPAGIYAFKIQGDGVLIRQGKLIAVR